MDLLILFEGIPSLPKAALDALRAGLSAREVAATHITPHLAQIEANAGQAMDPTYVAYLLEYVLQNSAHGRTIPL